MITPIVKVNGYSKGPKPVQYFDLAKTAAATNGTVKKTKYMPKCPENISAVPEESV